MLKYINKDMVHLRTKRKPSYKNIGSIVFAVILMFVFMSILITISDLTKRPKTEIGYAKNTQTENSNEPDQVSGSA